MSFPANPRATALSPGLFFLQESAGFHRVTDASLLVMPR
jgi:hypothetical protein